MKEIAKVLLAAIGGLVLAGCGSLFGGDDETRHPQCWAEIYQEERFDQVQPWTRLQGPVELEGLRDLIGHDWNDRISSIRVGPEATVEVYEHKNFGGEVREYGPGALVTDLDDDRMDDAISSIRIRCR